MPEDGKRSDLGWMPVQFVIISVMAGMFTVGGISLVRDSLEQRRALEAFHYLSLVRQAQHQFFDRKGTYSSNLDGLDIELPALQYFRPRVLREGVTGNYRDSWQLTLVRQDGWQGYGNYTVTFTDLGFDPGNSSIHNFQTINPLGA